jgi:NodT family efflux transporter outer membrane factor (OMF) lipoprotein
VALLTVGLPLAAQTSQKAPKGLAYTLPAAYSADSLIDQKLPIEEQWWASFSDPLLDSLMQTAMRNNWDLLVAQQRVAQARASMRSAYGALAPSFDLQAGWNRARSSQNTTAKTLTDDPYASYYSGAVSMNWEVDLFGRIRNQARSEKESYKASRADYYGSMVSVAASVGSAYINLRAAQSQIAVMESNIASEEEVVRITEARFKAGLASMLDVSQAKSTYYNTRAAIAAYQTSATQYINSLAVLTGQLPSQIRPSLIIPQPMPKSERLVPTSVPAALLRQRPDIKAAEYTVNAQSAALGVSRAEWLPTFFVTGEIGVASHDLDRLFDHPSMVWQIAPVMKWTIFNGGQRAAAVASSKAALQSSIDSYNLTVLTAMQEVENAIAAYQDAMKQTVELRSAVAEARRSFELSIDLYKQGLSAFINVVDAQQSLLSYETSLVSAQSNTLLSLIELYQALGGGWSEN